MPPVIASKQNSALFSDKEQIWADNACVEPVLRERLRLLRGVQGRVRARLHATAPLRAHLQRRRRHVDPEAGHVRHEQHQQRQRVRPIRLYRPAPTATGSSTCSCTSSPSMRPRRRTGKIQMIKSFNGGHTWTKPQNLFTILDGCAAVEPSIGRCVMDGVGGARDDLMPAPIRGHLPTEHPPVPTQPTESYSPRTEQLSLNDERVLFSTSIDRGDTWTALRNVTQVRVIAGTTRRPPSRRTGPTCGWSTTLSPRRSATARWAQPTIDSSWVSSCTRTSRAERSVPSPRSIAACPEMPGAPARTTWQRSSSGTTSTLRRPAPVRGGRVERRAQRSGLPGHRRVPPGSPRRGRRVRGSAGRPRRPRGAIEWEREHGLLAEPTNPATPPAVPSTARQLSANSDIFGGAWADPTP